MRVKKLFDNKIYEHKRVQQTCILSLSQQQRDVAPASDSPTAEPIVAASCVSRQEAEELGSTQTASTSA